MGSDASLPESSLAASLSTTWAATAAAAFLEAARTGFELVAREVKALEDAAAVVAFLAGRVLEAALRVGLGRPPLVDDAGAGEVGTEDSPAEGMDKSSSSSSSA